MNYRHAFHAGNFADLVKHATITSLLAVLTHDAAPIRVIDTHAGAGAYDLTGDLAQKTREAEAGITRLMADDQAPVAFAPLKAAVGRLNPAGGVRFYPGSPLLIAQWLRPDDRYLGCEVRPDDHAALVDTLKPFPNTRALMADGYAEAEHAPRSAARPFVLIDPPFERPDDYDQILATTAAVVAADARAVVAAWLPLKDLETFDSFLRRLEDLEPGRIVAAEARLKPLHEPMRMNGCAMVLVGAPPEVEAPLAEVCDWVAARLGGPGARGRVTVIRG
jgi:23S rRNA (adenine2030-N6)-methyltransferase